MPGAGSELGRTQAREGARRGPRRGRASLRALGGSRGRARGTARLWEGGVGREGAEEAALTGKGPQGLSPASRGTACAAANGRQATVPRRPALPANRPPPFWIRSLLRGLRRPRPPLPLAHLPAQNLGGRKAGGAAVPRPRTPLGFPYSPHYYRCRRLPAQEPRSRLGARSALEGRGVANRSARPRPPRPPSYCQSPQRLSLPAPAVSLGAGLQPLATPTRQPQVSIGYRRIAQTALAFAIGCAVAAAPSRSSPSGAAHGRLTGCHSAGPFPSSVRGWEAEAEAESPFQTAAKASRRGWAPGHGLRREQVETWPSSSPRGPRSGRSPPPGRAASAGPGWAGPGLSAPRRRFPQGRESPTPPAPAAPRGARPRDSISKACGISCLSFAGRGQAGCFHRVGKGRSPVPQQLQPLS